MGQAAVADGSYPEQAHDRRTAAAPDDVLWESMCNLSKFPWPSSTCGCVHRATSSCTDQPVAQTCRSADPDSRADEDKYPDPRWEEERESFKINFEDFGPVMQEIPLAKPLNRSPHPWPVTSDKSKPNYLASDSDTSDPTTAIGACLTETTGDFSNDGCNAGYAEHKLPTVYLASASNAVYFQNPQEIEEALREGVRVQLEQDKAECARRAEKERMLAERTKVEMMHERRLCNALDGLHCEVDRKKAMILMTKFLLANRFTDLELNMPRFRKGDYPLHVAAGSKDTEMVTLLLKHKADPRKRNAQDRTPAELAASKSRKGSHDKVVAVLESVTQSWDIACKALEDLRSGGSQPLRAKDLRTPTGENCGRSVTFKSDGVERQCESPPPDSN